MCSSSCCIPGLGFIFLSLSGCLMALGLLFSCITSLGLWFIVCRLFHSLCSLSSVYGGPGKLHIDVLASWWLRCHLHLPFSRHFFHWCFHSQIITFVQNCLNILSKIPWVLQHILPVHNRCTGVQVSTEEHRSLGRVQFILPQFWGSLRCMVCGTKGEGEGSTEMLSKYPQLPLPPSCFLLTLPFSTGHWTGFSN